ncbi:23S rRNA (guanosine(2251)-2'-O)-methyltransferase RlmB [Marinobacterium rhizophilum]|uniref:23S rRNA (guanosine-2'-O-)-methyltransferase RlmB n=1 Tax=Marinobacterium rhizophilum TaxID=420402 RepID=A0ABY5HHI3_9GAMM|nr:23S rRNA (guanosine(2251)-2'-O)-methyltransferase RlmB [Marinobacterium rhizophilum]UTW11817.1 23S rRNA (guanosine(2251)-2'-O)-methyltransferase RlmB [Marinobacterium rhizophilum]
MEDEILFGQHAVRTALKRDSKRIKRLLVQQGRNDERIQQVIDLASPVHVRPERVSRQELDRLADGGVHQGVLVLCDPILSKDEAFLDQLLDGLETAPFLLVLDGVTDPHNLGACLRTADAAGVQAVIAPKDKSAPLNSTVSKVACGAAEVVPYVQVTNLARTLQMLQERGIWITGTAGEAQQLVYDASLTGPMALIMGAEGKGMRRLTREHCDHLVKIPMSGEVSSLNVSVAAGVCLFEAVRQRREG